MAKRPQLSWAAKLRGRVNGYRSGLEDKVAKELASLGIKADYETLTLRYLVPAREARYKPDFVLPNGIIIETKGRFVTADRKKHKLIREQYPDLDVRFVFSNPNSKIGPKSKTTYADWCDHVGIPYAAKSVPLDWLSEPAKPKRTAALKAVQSKPTKEKPCRTSKSSAPSRRRSSSSTTSD